MKDSAAASDAEEDSSTYVGRDDMSIESLPTKPRRPADWNSSASMILRRKVSAMI